jgi:hypothetical protein
MTRCGFTRIPRIEDLNAESGEVSYVAGDDYKVMSRAVPAIMPSAVLRGVPLKWH